MRNLKKFLALVLAMLMVVSAAATVSAFEDVAEDNLFADAIADLSVLDIVNGYDGETFGPEDAVTRQQFALMMARAITGITDDAEWAQGGLVAFDDVTEYQYAIATVVKAGIVDGFLDNTFRPEEGVTFIQALKMAVCALGYDDGTLDWWQGYYNVALDLGLTANLNQIPTADYALNRGEVAQLIYNMIYATAANGSSLAYDIFGIGVEEPVEEPAEITVMALVATNKQYATENINVAEGNHIGFQEIVNGVPSGEVYYLPIADFGFETAAEAEAFFLDAFAFENWNDGEYDAAYRLDNKSVIYNTEITETAKGATNLGKLTIADKNYYMVEAKTGSTIRNEVVVFNSNDTAYVYTDKVLALDEDGKILAADGTTVLAARFNSKGEIVAYYDYAASAYIDEEQATEKYGIPVVSNYDTHLGVMAQDKLVGAYQLTVYDDDMDGEMDRAYYTPVYANAYNAKNSSGAEVFGPMNGVKGVTYTAELAKGDVFTYTYNSQLKVVNVLATYDVQYGTINKIRTTTDTSSNDYKVTVTIDGVDYILGNAHRDGKGLQSFSILTADRKNVTQIANLSGKNNDGSNFNSGVASIGYTYNSDFGPNTFKAKNPVRFVAIDGVIILMESYDIEENFDLVVLEQATGYDFDAIYVDLWMNGELVEDVAITSIQQANGKYVDIADLNDFKYASILSTFGDAEGNVYKAVATADGYQLSLAFDYDGFDADGESYSKVWTSVDDQGTTKTSDDIWSIIRNEYKLAYVPQRGRAIRFVDGYGEVSTSDDKNVIRTDSDTVFYFINDDDVSVFKGQPKDGSRIVANSNIYVYADKLGYTAGEGATEADAINAIKGVADTVVVFYTDDSQITGFSITGIGNKLVYVTAATSAAQSYFGKDADLFDPYFTADAEDLGLSKQYWGERFYYYNTNIGINMYTGERVNQLYVNEDSDIEPGNFYWVSDDNVVLELVDDLDDILAGNSVLNVRPLVKEDVEEGRRGLWKVDGGDFNKVVMAKYNVELKADYVYANDKVVGILSDDDEEPSIVVNYVTGSTANDDALVVGIVFPYEEELVGDTAPNAVFVDGIADAYYMGKLDLTASKTEITGSVKFSKDPTDSGDVDYATDIFLTDEEDLLDITGATISNVTVKKGSTVVANSANGIGATPSLDGFAFRYEVEDNTITFVMTAGRKTQSVGSAEFGVGSDTYTVTMTVTVNGETYDVTGTIKL